MIDLNALERQLAEESLRIVGPEPVVDDAAIFAAVTSGGSSWWKLTSVLGAARFVAAGLVVALAGSVVLNDLLPRSSSLHSSPAPAAATSVAEPGEATITFPPELPPGSRRGTLETDAGRIEWIEISGEEMSPGAGGTLPRAQRLVPWDDGIAAWSAHGLKVQLASTTDGVTWQVEELPAEPGTGKRHWSKYGNPGLGVIDEMAYLVLSESGQVWSREAGSEWAPLETPVIGEVMPGNGWERRSRVASAPRMVGDDVYFEITDLYTLPREQLGIPSNEWTEWLTPLDGGRFALCNHKCTGADERRRRTFLVDPTETGLRVTDDRTGDELGVIEGATTSELYEGEYGRHTAAFVIDGSTVVQVEPLPAGAPGRDDPEVVVPDPPADTAPEMGIEWLRREAQDKKWTSRWVLIGDEWVSLAGVVPRSQRWLSGVRTGDVIALTSLSDSDPPTMDLWLLALADGT